MSEPAFQVRRAVWSKDRDFLYAVRHAVFVVEQDVPFELEIDEHDDQAVHFLACDAAGAPVGTARLVAGARIGRMAVLRQWRGRGVGGALLAAAVLEAAESGAEHVELHAQVHAIPFYARHGFAAYGDVFDDAGIPHRAMRRGLREISRRD